MTFADLRKEYMQRGLSEEDLDADPVRQFQLWFDAAVRPSARMVLLKGVDAAGFVFYTNYESRKGGELAANPYAALVFFWVELERQVRIEGRVERVSAEQSDA